MCARRQSPTHPFFKGIYHLVPGKPRNCATQWSGTRWMLLFSVGPFTQTNSNKLESVQRSAARYVLADYQSSVPSMTQQLEWKPLQQVDKQQKQCKCTSFYFTGHSILNIDCRSLRSEQRHLDFSCGTHYNSVSQRFSPLTCSSQDWQTWVSIRWQCPSF